MKILGKNGHPNPSSNGYPHDESYVVEMSVHEFDCVTGSVDVYGTRYKRSVGDVHRVCDIFKRLTTMRDMPKELNQAADQLQGMASVLRACAVTPEKANAEPVPSIQPDPV